MHLPCITFSMISKINGFLASHLKDCGDFSCNFFFWAMKTSPPFHTLVYFVVTDIRKWYNWPIFIRHDVYTALHGRRHIESALFGAGAGWMKTPPDWLRLLVT